uniref:Uncharacterized protein n=1 Tax=Brassica oleracea TaxID=3712 RepID=A0A3P6EXS7_BRAOL|nr:unnamed protein product [Brassica oleracea]
MVVAKIEAIDLDKPWYYTACNFCKRKMARQGDGFEETCNIFNIILYTTAKHATRILNMLFTMYFLVTTWLYVSLMTQREKSSFCFSTILRRGSLGDLRLS